jgi:hypothetical protein
LADLFAKAGFFAGFLCVTPHWFVVYGLLWGPQITLGIPQQWSNPFPTRANRSTRLQRSPCANAPMKRTSLVEHNLYFARARDGGIHKRSKPKGLRQKLIIIIIHHAIITTISILNLRPETIAPINVAQMQKTNLKYVQIFAAGKNRADLRNPCFC